MQREEDGVEGERDEVRAPEDGDVARREGFGGFLESMLVVRMDARRD